MRLEKLIRFALDVCMHGANHSRPMLFALPLRISVGPLAEISRFDSLQSLAIPDFASMGPSSIIFSALGLLVVASQWPP